ncbi:MAG: enoyl-CoA hydratase [Betaproteobacteria bacterium]|nr:enoyl-CoA hydratase [Betaproteobacteria bacterium]
MSQLIKFTREGAVVLIGINRPDKKNALTAQMYIALADALYTASADEGVRVALLHGEGGCFTAGNDLADFAAARPDANDTPAMRFLREIAHFRKPLVAAVEGVAVGIGTTMLLHCDLVYATPQTRFALPFVNLAVVPEAASSYLLPRIAGWQRAAELLMLGEPFSAEQAFAAGMINSIVAPDRLMETAMAAASKLATKPPIALRETKRLMKLPEMDRIDSAMRAEARVFARRLQSPEAKEAFAAFFEKRKPDFSRF